MAMITVTRILPGDIRVQCSINPDNIVWVQNFNGTTWIETLDNHEIETVDCREEVLAKLPS